MLIIYITLIICKFRTNLIYYNDIDLCYAIIECASFDISIDICSEIANLTTFFLSWLH